MLKVKCKGDWTKSKRFLKKLQKLNYRPVLEKYGADGVKALSSATPIDTGNTANSWFYEIEESDNRSVLHFCNSHVEDGVNIAIILQYGHGTGSGVYISGRNYIPPAIQPVFDDMTKAVWREVTS